MLADRTIRDLSVQGADLAMNLNVVCHPAARRRGGGVGLRRSLRLHAAGGLLVLLAITTLGVYKPQGRIEAAMPRWAKVRGRPRRCGNRYCYHAPGGGHGPGAHIPR